MIKARALASAIIALAITTPNAAQAEKFEVHRFHEPGPGSVNSWVLEGENSLVLIDGQRTIQAGEAVVELIKSRGKPLSAILITHPHPDHVGGIPTILESFPGTPVYASKGTSDELVSDSLGMFEFARNVNGDAYPNTLAEVTNIIADGEVINFDDISLVVDNLGPSESIAMTMFYNAENSALFTGDLIDNNMHGFLLEQRTDKWLAQLAYVELEYDQDGMIAYPGHGAVGELETLTAEQVVWLNDMRSLVADTLDDGELSDGELSSVLAEFEKRHPEQLRVAPIPGLRALNARAVAEELLRDAE